MRHSSSSIQLRAPAPTEPCLEVPSWNLFMHMAAQHAKPEGALVKRIPTSHAMPQRGRSDGAKSGVSLMWHSRLAWRPVYRGHVYVSAWLPSLSLGY